jgi:hypothetical protein
MKISMVLDFNTLHKFITKGNIFEENFKDGKILEFKQQYKQAFVVHPTKTSLQQS